MLIDPQARVPMSENPHGQHLSQPIAARGLPPRELRPRASEARRSLPGLIEAFVKATSLADLIDMIPARVAAYLGCRRVLLYEVRDEMLQLASSTAEATTQGYTSTLLRIASLQMMLTDSAPETRALQGERAIVEPGGPDAPARIIAPMHGLGGPVGVLVIIPSDDEVVWGGDGLPASQMLILGMEDIARVSAITLESAHLLTDNHKRSEEMDLLTRLTNAFNSNILDLDAAIGIVERQVSRITKVDLCAVVLGTTAQRGQPQPTRWLRNEIIKSIQQMRAPILLDNVQVWHLAHLLPEGVRSFYAFPLQAEDRVVGVLALAFYSPHSMEEGERNLLSILANTASTVLQKARLHAEAERARHQAREMLERALNEERFKDAILRNIQTGLITIDLEGRVTLINHQAAQLLGQEDTSAVGLPIEEVMPIVDNGPHLVRAALNPRMAPQKREVRVRTAAGNDLWLTVTIAPLRLADGKDIGVMCAFLDVTGMRALEDEMRRLENVSNMGQEASSISHDMRNIGTALMMGIQKVLPMVASNDEARIDMSLMLKELNRLTSLAENLMSLTKPRPLQPTSFELGELFERILRMLNPRATLARVIIERNFETGVVVLADEMQVARAIENLCINALEAMSKGGKLTVTTRTTRTTGPLDNRRVAPPDLRLHLPSYNGASETELLLPDGRQRAVEIEITDTGVGIPPERQQAIWEPFKTFGKGAGGHGLGLAIVKQVVEAHGGTITLASEVGRGTTFTLRLPAGR